MKKTGSTGRNPERSIDITPPHIRRHRANVFQSGLIALVIAFAALALFVRQSAFFPADLKITRFLQSLDSVMSVVMSAVSWAGYSPQSFILVVLAAVLLYIFRLRWEALVAALSALFEELLNFLAKVMIHRPRPTPDLVHVIKVLSGYSFPSGHVMFYTVFFGYLWFLIFTLMKHSWQRAALLAVVGSQVLLIGVSRVWLGEHWASDAVGAYLLGGIALMAVIRFYRWGKPRFFVRGAEGPGGGR